MVVILASLHIGKEKDEHGNDVEITDDLKGDVLMYVATPLNLHLVPNLRSNGNFSYPLSMPCTISKREDFEF